MFYRNLIILPLTLGRSPNISPDVTIYLNNSEYRNKGEEGKQTRLGSGVPYVTISLTGGPTGAQYYIDS